MATRQEIKNVLHNNRDAITSRYIHPLPFYKIDQELLKFYEVLVLVHVYVSETFNNLATMLL